MRNFSFSVKPSEHEKLLLVQQIKKYCDERGMSFSHFVLNAIKEHFKNTIKTKDVKNDKDQ